ncbi:MAG: VOC family protein [Rhodanobacteraceae bacterium]
MQLNPYLFYDGQCEAAFKLYSQVLHGEITAMMRYGDAPGCEDMSTETRGRIIHACLKIGELTLMASDACPPQHPYQRPQGISVALAVDSVAEADRIFKALVEQATVLQPLEKTFFAARFGMLVDRFSVPWMITCEKDV